MTDPTRVDRVLTRVKEGHREMVACHVWRITKDIKRTVMEKSTPCKGRLAESVGQQGYFEVPV